MHLQSEQIRVDVTATVHDRAFEKAYARVTEFVLASMCQLVVAERRACMSKPEFQKKQANQVQGRI